MSNAPDNFEQKLAAELKRLYAAPPMADRDEQILSAARSAGEAAVRGRWKWRVGLGLAAAVVLAAGIMWAEFYRGRTPPPAAMPAAFARTGDIRDAYYVARQLKQHATPASIWDTNGDGIVDDKDVQSLALAAVHLPVEKGVVR